MDERQVILIVDDDSVVRDVLFETIGRLGFEVLQAADGQEALELIRRHRPDLVISDIIMPRLDGWDLCHTVRSEPATRSIPFVFLTSQDSTPDKIIGLRLGADDYLTKPFSPPAVAFKIKAILKRMAIRGRLLGAVEVETDHDRRDFLLADLLEYLVNQKRTGLVAFHALQEKGLLAVASGRLVHASMGSLSGDRAAMEMFRLHPTKISFHEGIYPNLDVNVESDSRSLLAAAFTAAAD